MQVFDCSNHCLHLIIYGQKNRVQVKQQELLSCYFQCCPCSLINFMLDIFQPPCLCTVVLCSSGIRLCFVCYLFSLSCCVIRRVLQADGVCVQGNVTARQQALELILAHSKSRKSSDNDIEWNPDLMPRDQLMSILAHVITSSGDLRKTSQLKVCLSSCVIVYLHQRARSAVYRTLQCQLFLSCV